jgi:hypothetical protein
MLREDLGNYLTATLVLGSATQLTTACLMDLRPQQNDT